MATETKGGRYYRTEEFCAQRGRHRYPGRSVVDRREWGICLDCGHVCGCRDCEEQRARATHDPEPATRDETDGEPAREAYRRFKLAILEALGHGEDAWAITTMNEARICREIERLRAVSSPEPVEES